jgi:hypothetical protein
MDSTFLSKENLDNIYEYLNTKTVHNYNINLNTNEKYKKIVKKLSKTIFKSLNSKIKNMSINEFNELVVNKSLPFIKLNIDKEISTIKYLNSDVNSAKSNDTKPINYSELNENIMNIGNNNSLKLVSDNKQKQKKKTKKNNKNDEYDNYLKDALEFETLVKQSNSKIKNNFKELVKTTQNNFIKKCDLEDVDSFVMNRCIAKDNVIEKGLSNSAFEEIIKKNTLNNMNNNNNNNNNNNISNYPTSSISSSQINNETNAASTKDDLVNFYDNNDINYKKLFTEILINQKDFSKHNKIESYEGETYLPNLIANYGEEAPIQPLLYQNTKSGTEILNTFNIIIDTGNTAGGSFPDANNTPDTELDLTSIDNNSVVTLTGIFPWQQFRVNLDEQFKLDKITDVYLKSFSLIGPTTMDKCLYFVLDIQEFNIRTQSNNPHFKSKIVIQNTTHAKTFIKESEIDNTGANGTITASNTVNVGPTVDTVFTKSYTKYSNYLTTITPSNFTTLNFELTNENNEGADDGDNKTFLDRSSKKNRIIFELDFVTRKLKDPIFDYTISKETLDKA